MLLKVSSDVILGERLERDVRVLMRIKDNW